jgi:hypothetical protein
MAYNFSPKIVTDGLMLYLDAANTRSYPGTGTVWSDLSRSGNNGTLTNFNSPSPQTIFNSANGGSIIFDGTNDYVNLPEITPTLFTLSCWFRATGVPSTNDFFGGNLIISNPQLFGGNVQYSLAYSWLNQTIGFAVQQNGGGAFTPTNSVLRNTIYNAVGVFTGTRNQIYINGSFVVETVNTTTPIYPSTGDRSARIGAWNSPGFPGFTRFFNGNIYQASIYNRALSATEIRQNYNATKTRFGL